MKLDFEGVAAILRVRTYAPHVRAILSSCVLSYMDVVPSRSDAREPKMKSRDRYAYGTKNRDVELLFGVRTDKWYRYPQLMAMRWFLEVQHNLWSMS